MTEPTFDANGWCSDMLYAPTDGTFIVATKWDERGLLDEVMVLLWDEFEDLGWLDARDHFTVGEDHFTHWKPLGPGPVGT